MENLEKRSLNSDFDIRSKDDGKVVIEGYAARFEDETVIGGKFAERIARGAFDKANMKNTVALFNHDWNMPLARVDRGLELSVDDKGLKYRFEVGSQSYAKDLVENIRMGNVSTSSFGFTISDDSWERRDDGVNLRTINAVETLYDVSPTTQGAYPTTDVALRSMESFFDQEIEEELRKLEEEEEEKAMNEEEEEEDDRYQEYPKPEEEEEEKAMDEEEEEKQEEEEEEEEQRVDDLVDPSILPHPYSQAYNSEPTEARNNQSKTKMENSKKNSAPAVVQSLGDSEARSVEQFSFGKMVKEAAQGRLTGLEAEMNQEARNEFSNAKVNVAGGICIPSFVARAALGTATVATGDANSTAFGGTIGTVDRGIVEAFKPVDLAARMGARNLTGLTGDVVFQVQGTPSAAGKPDEGDSRAVNNTGFSAVTLSPTRYSAHTQVTDQMLAQSADDMGAFLAKDIRDAIAKSFNADIITAISTAAATNATVSGTLDAYDESTNNPLDLEAALLGRDVDLDNVKCLSAADSYRTLRALSHDAGSGMLFAESPVNRRQVMGYETMISSQVTSQDFFMFDIEQLVTGTWGGLNLIVDPYTDADHGVTRMIANVYRSVATLQNKGFDGMQDVVAPA